jgi:toxin HigB-1
VIKSFRHRGLLELWQAGKTKHIAPELQSRCRRRLEFLDAALRPSDMNLPGFNFHQLRGTKRFTVHVNGPSTITFEWANDAIRVDLEQYH